MLNHSLTRIGSNTFHVEILPGVTIDQEGTVLVAKQLNGKTYAAPSEGTAGEVFLGFATGRGSAATGDTVKYIDAVIPKGDDANGNPLEPSVLLEGTPVLAAIKVTVNGTAQTPQATAAEANKPQLVGNKLLFLAADAGKRVQGIYATNRVQGDAALHHPTVSALGRIAVIRSGDICTDMFDINGAYEGTGGVPPVLKTGANGKLTTAGSGTPISGIVLLEAPGAGTGGFIKVRAGI